ncbi:hypothetical protein KR009_002161, partial [Drosophila setifemur]
KSKMVKNSSGNGLIEEFTWPFMVSVLESDVHDMLMEAIGHVLLGLVSVMVARKCLRIGLQRTADHAFYSTIGLFLCVGESILVSHSWWLTAFLSHTNRILLHGVLGALALWTGFVGIFAKSLMRHRDERLEGMWALRHFASKHAKCGVIGYLLIAGALITGLFLMRYAPLALHLIHRLVGMIGVMCLASSQWFAYNSGFARREWPIRQIHLLKLGTLGASLVTFGHELLEMSEDLVHILPTKWFKTLLLKV